MEILAGAQVAQKMHGRRAERIMPRIQPRTSLLDVDPQALILRAPRDQLLPIAGGQQHAVAIEDIAARNLARQELMRGLCCARFTPSSSNTRASRARYSRSCAILVARRERNQHHRTRPPAPRRPSAAVRGTSAWPSPTEPRPSGSGPIEIASSSAKMKKFASMAVFPELRNGDTTPESGSAPSTPAEISNISKASREASPSARKKA